MAVPGGSVGSGLGTGKVIASFLVIGIEPVSVGLSGTLPGVVSDVESDEPDDEPDDASAPAAPEPVLGLELPPHAPSIKAAIVQVIKAI